MVRVLDTLWIRLGSTVVLYCLVYLPCARQTHLPHFTQEYILVLKIIGAIWERIEGQPWVNVSSGANCYYWQSSKTQKTNYIFVGLKIVSEYSQCSGHVAETVFLLWSENVLLQRQNFVPTTCGMKFRWFEFVHHEPGTKWPLQFSLLHLITVSATTHVYASMCFVHISLHSLCNMHLMHLFRGLSPHYVFATCPLALAYPKLLY